MILQALHQLARQEELVGDPDYEWKEIPWLIRVDADGRLLGIEGTRQTPPQVEGKKTRPKPIAKAFLMPREQGRTSGDYAFFLFDKSDYVFGLDPAGKSPKEKLAPRAEMFRTRVRQCAEATQDEAAVAMAELLHNIHSGQQRVELPEECGPADLFAFVFAPDQEILVTSRPKIREYWKSLRRGGPDAKAGNLSTCLVTGRPCVPVGKHPPIKRVPGGTTSGVAVVSFNASAFESYGWAGNLNAPVSREAAENCATALNRLLSDRPQNAKGEPLPIRNIRLSSDTVVCYWVAGPSKAADYIAGLLEANPDEVGEVYRSIWRGKAPHITDPSAFYALTLSGAQGRAVVRDWLESTVAQTLDHLARHFADLEIVRNTPKPKDHDLPPQIPMRALMRSLAPQGKDEGIPATLAGQLISAALQGTEYPFSLLQRALERARAEIGHADWADLERRDARAALIKAVLNRRKSFRAEHTTQYKEITTAMDPNNTNSGYLLGRLIAVIEGMQQLALGNVNASAVDRFFSGASATPRAVFPRLLRNLRHHARKALDSDKTRGIARWLETQVDQILWKVQPTAACIKPGRGEPAKIDQVIANVEAFPSHLDLEQQAHFVLGYHHMRHWLRNKEAREPLQPANVQAGEQSAE